MSEVFAEQLTAVANVVLAIFAIVTAIFAGRALRAQSSQLEMELRERRREAEERRRAQAAQVFVWQDPPELSQRGGDSITAWATTVAHVLNTSKQPVFNLRIMWVYTGKPAGKYVLRAAPLMPGEEDTGVDTLPLLAERSFDTDTVAAVLDDQTAVAIFDDSAGLSWRRYVDGRLEEFGPNSAAPTVALVAKSLPSD
jgi:hypothetical protein